MRRLLLALAAGSALIATPAFAHPHGHYGFRGFHSGYSAVSRHPERRPARLSSGDAFRYHRGWQATPRLSYGGSWVQHGGSWVQHGGSWFHGGYDGGGSNDAAARARGLPDCGAYMADQFGFHGALARTLWLARNWAHMGHATSPHPGAVAVWPHHVVKIVGGQDAQGRWLVQDNHGRGGSHAYYRSLRGVIAIRGGIREG